MNLSYFFKNKGHSGVFTCLKILILLLVTLYSGSLYAQKVKFDNKATLFVSPETGTLLADSTFEVSVFLNTHGTSVNTVELNLEFSPDTLSIVNPSSGKSIISLWSEPPRYSNTEGTATFSGGIPNGINTESGLIITVTFKAKTPGKGFVRVYPTSKVLANDGTGTNILLNLGRANFTIQPKPPKGVEVFSETHQFQDVWYNNSNPVLSWEKNDGVEEFSFELDNRPGTIPDNISDSKETVKAYENVPDGIWYFHIKAKKQGVWGGTTDFLLHIDQSPPAPFKPKVEVLTAAIATRALVSFFTTDLLSGIDHYEVGVIDKSKSELDSPAFIETQSPYQIPASVGGEVRVIVRAFDKAGNIQDANVDVFIPISQKIIFIIILLILLILFVLHYLFGHHVWAHFRRAFKIVREEEKKEHAIPPPQTPTPPTPPTQLPPPQPPQQ